jgi:hypothetical protein
MIAECACRAFCDVMSGKETSALKLFDTEDKRHE